MVVYLNSETFKRLYHSDVISMASFISFLMYAMMIVFPFALAFKTHEFGLRQSVLAEQPTVSYRSEIIIYNYNTTHTLGYSSVDSLDRLFGTKILSPIVKPLVSDDNKDGKADTFRFQISFSTYDTTNLKMSSIYLFFDYGIKERAKLQLQDFIKIDLSSPSGIEKVKVVGTIEFDQKKELETRNSSITNSKYNNSVFSSTNPNLNIVDFEKQKIARDDTIYCNCETTIMPALGTGLTEIDIELRVPSKQIIYVKRRILENLKFSWIEYVSIFIPLFVVLERVLVFILKNRIFPTRVINIVE